MASKTKTAQKEKEKEEAPEKEAPETPDTPLPLLDLSDAAVKKLIDDGLANTTVTVVCVGDIGCTENAIA